jgi:ABC-type Mn2+/Zn2+ transport system ATPase subunit
VTPLLKVSNLVAYRQSHGLFSPVSFHVGLGECLRITGGNGVGKTTLLDCLAGLYRNWSGNIEKPTGQISYLQQTSPYVRTLCLDQLCPLIGGFDESRYRQLVSSLDLARKRAKLLSLLSGGELQRARLLMALLRSHVVLILDEPFTNIDGASCNYIAAELERSQSHRATVIVTHLQDSHEHFLTRCPQYALSCSEH